MYKLLSFKSFVSENVSMEFNKQEAIFCGGSAGHMSHLHDDISLTFANIKELITISLSGELNREEQSTEKLDGQALAISYKDGNIIASRNKGDRKNFGENSLSVEDVITKFSGRGELSDAFGNAIQDLESAIKHLSKDTLFDIFQNGKCFMHLEVIYPGTTNVINYDSAKLIFHGLTEYDRDGNAIRNDKSAAPKLTKLITDIDKHLQKTYHISPPIAINLPKHIDFEAKQTYFLNKLSKIQSEAGLKDNDTIKDYLEFKFTELIDSETKNSDLDPILIKGLLTRWVEDNKSFNIKKLNTFTDDSHLIERLLNIEKKSESLYKEFIKPIELLILELGATILKNATGLLAANPDESLQKIKVELEKTIKELENTNDITKISKLRNQLEKIEAMGGFDTIVPTEGIVFTYNGKTYKMTGQFAPINQILGSLKFG